jgi:hypothetical protein
VTGVKSTSRKVKRWAKPTVRNFEHFDAPTEEPICVPEYLWSAHFRLSVGDAVARGRAVTPTLTTTSM